MRPNFTDCIRTWPLFPRFRLKLRKLRSYLLLVFQSQSKYPTHQVDGLSIFS